MYFDRKYKTVNFKSYPIGLISDKEVVGCSPRLSSKLGAHPTCIRVARTTIITGCNNVTQQEETRNDPLYLHYDHVAFVLPDISIQVLLRAIKCNTYGAGVRVVVSE